MSRPLYTRPGTRKKPEYMENIVFTLGSIKIPTSLRMRMSAFWTMAAIFMLFLVGVVLLLVAWLANSITSVAINGPSYADIFGIIVPSLIFAAAIFHRES